MSLQMNWNLQPSLHWDWIKKVEKEVKEFGEFFRGRLDERRNLRFVALGKIAITAKPNF